MIIMTVRVIMIDKRDDVEDDDYDINEWENYKMVMIY